MPQLYTDSGPPVRACGYASIFGATYRNGGVYERIAPGAFSNLKRYAVFACFSHDHSRRLAWTIDNSLQVWQDDTGLAFQFALPSNHTGLGLIAGIRRGNFRGASFHSIGNADIDVVNEDGRPIHVINRIDVCEVCLTSIGANPDATVWLDCEPVDEMPAYVASARQKWLAGLPKAQAPAAKAPRITAHGGRATRPSAAVLARIDRVLAANRRR